MAIYLLLAGEPNLFIPFHFGCIFGNSYLAPFHLVSVSYRFFYMTSEYFSLKQPYSHNWYNSLVWGIVNNKIIKIDRIILWLGEQIMPIPKEKGEVVRDPINQQIFTLTRMNIMQEIKNASQTAYTLRVWDAGLGRAAKWNSSTGLGGECRYGVLRILLQHQHTVWHHGLRLVVFLPCSDRELSPSSFLNIVHLNEVIESEINRNRLQTTLLF